MRKAINLVRTVFFFTTLLFFVFLLATIEPIISWIFPRHRTRVFNIFLRFFSMLLARSTFAKIVVRGKENIPANGGFIIVANHTSFLDNLLLLGIIPHDLRFVAASPGFTLPMMRRVYSAANFISSDIKMELKDLMLLFMAIKNGENVGAYSLLPDEEKGGEIGEFTPALISFIKTTNTPFLPIAIKGTSTVWPTYEYKIIGTKIEVTIGKLQPAENADNLNKIITDLYNS